MKTGIMQPYFLPYIGYWQLMRAVDIYVIYDDVNFIKGGWINRNNILVGGQKKTFTVELREASQNKLINEIETKDDFRKLKKTIEMNYSKAPYFHCVMPILNEIFDFENRNLALFIANSFYIINRYLSIDSKLIFSSDLDKDSSLKAQNKILDICDKVGATEYYNAIGGQEIYSEEKFKSNNIELKFLKTDTIVYPQFKNSFVPYLSILDIMMFNSVEEIDEMLNKYELI